MPVLFVPKIKLVRKPPIGLRNVRAVIKKEVVDAWERILWPAVKTDLDDMWTTNPPFKHRIFTPRTGYRFRAYVDMRTTLGKRFWWSDRGTGLDGPKRAKYPIPRVAIPRAAKLEEKEVAKEGAKKGGGQGMYPRPGGAKLLQFVVPYQPGTLPVATLRYNPGAPPKFITKVKLMHPGIQYRGFSIKIKAKFENTAYSKGIYKVTKDAYDRAFRQLM